jgi:hypothetical protein
LCPLGLKGWLTHNVFGWVELEVANRSLRHTFTTLFGWLECGFMYITPTNILPRGGLIIEMGKGN